MTGGDLKIEVLPAGAVVPAFGLLDAVSKGTLDGGHGVLVYHYGKQNALALWGSGPAFGMDANQLLAWHKYGGGKELLNKLYASIGANVVSFPYGPMPTQPLGWFKKPITKAEDFKGLKFRTVGISIDVFTGAGRGGQRAARRRDRAGDGPRPARRGRVQQRDLRPHPRLRRRLQGVHAAELPPERRAVRDHVQQDQVRRAAGEDEGDHRERGRGRLGRHVVEGGRPLLQGLRRAADQGQGELLQDARTRCCSSQLDGVRRGGQEARGQRAVGRDRELAAGVRRARGALGPRHQREPRAWPTTTTSARSRGRAPRRPERRRHTRDTIRRTRMVFFASQAAQTPAWTLRSMQKIAALRRQGEHLGRPRVLVADRRRSPCWSPGRCSPATRSTPRTPGRST